MPWTWTRKVCEDVECLIADGSNRSGLDMAGSEIAWCGCPCSDGYSIYRMVGGWMGITLGSNIGSEVGSTVGTVFNDC